MIAPMTRWRPVGEGCAFYLLGLLAVWVWREGRLFSPDDAWWLIPLTWIVLATVATWPFFHESRDLFTAEQWIGSINVTVTQLFLTSVAVLPLFIAIDLLYHGWWHGRSIVLSWPAGWGRMVFYQVAYVGFPEELFFRGYLQRRFDDACGRPYRLFGASWGAGLLMANLLFAAGHVVVTGEVERLSVFFPGLLFGWLQARTGALIAPILFHGLCNIVLFTLQAWVK
jgi:membrane protease YdiL (CAAX protease family)